MIQKIQEVSGRDSTFNKGFKRKQWVRVHFVEITQYYYFVKTEVWSWRARRRCGTAFFAVLFNLEWCVVSWSYLVQIFFCILVSRDEFPGAEHKVSSKQNLSNRKCIELVSFIALVWLCHGTRFFLVLWQAQAGLMETFNKPRGFIEVIDLLTQIHLVQ